MSFVLTSSFFNSEPIPGCNLVPVANYLPIIAHSFQNSFWSKNGNAAAFEYGPDGSSVTLTSISANQRPFIGITWGTYSLPANSYFVLVATVDILSGALTQDTIQADTHSGRHNASKRLAVYFDTNTTTTPTVRIGVGAGGAETLGVSVRIKDVDIIKVADANVRTGSVAPHFHVHPGCQWYFKYANANTQVDASSSGSSYVKAVTETLGAEITTGVFPQLLSTVSLGDSHTNGTASSDPDLPVQMASLLPGCMIYACGKQGYNSSADPTWGIQQFAADAFSLSGITIPPTVYGAFPQVAMIEIATNDVGLTLAEVQAGIQTLVGYAKAAGIRNIALATAMPSSTFTSPQEVVRGQQNQWKRDYAAANGFGLMDMDVIARDPAALTQLLAAYDDGGHVHLSSAGYQAVAFGGASAIRSAFRPFITSGQTAGDRCSLGPNGWECPDIV